VPLWGPCVLLSLEGSVRRWPAKGVQPAGRRWRFEWSSSHGRSSAGGWRGNKPGDGGSLDDSRLRGGDRPRDGGETRLAEGRQHMKRQRWI
jgi:hypothetical protein